MSLSSYRLDRVAAARRLGIDLEILPPPSSEAEARQIATRFAAWAAGDRRDGLDADDPRYRWLSHEREGISACGYLVHETLSAVGLEQPWIRASDGVDTGIIWRLYSHGEPVAGIPTLLPGDGYIIGEGGLEHAGIVRHFDPDSLVLETWDLGQGSRTPGRWRTRQMRLEGARLVTNSDGRALVRRLDLGKLWREAREDGRLGSTYLPAGHAPVRGGTWLLGLLLAAGAALLLRRAL